MNNETLTVLVTYCLGDELVYKKLNPTYARLSSVVCRLNECTCASFAADLGLA